ncbi:MAG TPA: rod shape-determining protein RodA [Candidatus Kapabacteria bacterium]|nr:rod shape-determining protein RodA [Candidatus Kapabacteria bacterium]
MAIVYEKQINVKPGPFEHFDITTFFTYILLVGIGLISIYSATYDAGMSTNFFKQLTFVGMSIVVLFITMFLPLRWIVAYTEVAYISTLVLLLIVIFFGKEIAGTKGWIGFGGFGIQPAELAKLVTLLAVAKFLTSKGADIKKIRDLGTLALIVIVPVALIVLQPDVGTASVFAAILLGVLLWVGFDIFTLFIVIALPVIFLISLLGTTYYIVSLVIFSAVTILFRKKIYISTLAIVFAVVIGMASPLIFNNLMPHQKGRIETFLNPGNDPRGKGYNVIQSTLAVGSGGMTGKGFLQGTQTQLRYIPEQSTDFIFCVPTEEFGFVGGSVVIILIASLMLRALRISAESNSKYLSIVSFGIASIFFYHSIINIGMVIGLMPVMGIPLPFLSYGGSALLTNSAMVGLLLNAYRLRRKN